MVSSLYVFCYSVGYKCTAALDYAYRAIAEGFARSIVKAVKSRIELFIDCLNNAV